MVGSTSSKPPFKPGKIKTSDGRGALPRPRNVLLPFVLVFLVLLLVFAVVLSANGGKNLLAVFKALDIPLPQFLTVAMRAPVAADIEAPAMRRWPWLKGISHQAELRLSVPTPETMCEGLASNGQETPSFTRSGNSDWECSTLVERPGAMPASSLFLQVRGGADGKFALIRVKFNLADGRMTKDLSQSALAFLRAAMALPPSDEFDDALRQRMEAQADFYFVAGYYALTFRREIDDPDRYNLIGVNRKTIGVERIESWPKAVSQSARAPKGPRHSAQTAGSR